MSTNRDGVPVVPFGIIGFILGWFLVSAWRNPGKTVLLVGALWLVITLIPDTSQDYVSENQVAASTISPAKTKDAPQDIAKGCPDEPPNGPVFPC